MPDVHHPNDQHPAATDSVHVLVNNNNVKLPNRKATGLQIKEAAFAQGVKIKIDFKLFRVTGATQHPVGDTEQITVHDGEKFVCVAPDDNS